MSRAAPCQCGIREGRNRTNSQSPSGAEPYTLSSEEGKVLNVTAVPMPVS